MPLPTRKPFSMQGAAPGTQYNRDRLTKLGRYLCRVVDIREQKGFRGQGFWMDLEVVKGPARPGREISRAIYPDKAKGNNKMSQEQVYAKEMGKIQLCVAAALGFGLDQVSEVDDEVYQASLGKGNKGEAGYKPSPLKGKFVVAVVKSYAKDDEPAESKTFMEIEPHTNENEEFEEYVEPVSPAKKAPGAASAPAAQALKEAAKKAPPTPPKKTYEQAMAEAGFIVHPGDSDFAWNEETDEVVEHEELKVRLLG